VPRIRNTITSFLDEVRRKEEFARHWLLQQGQQVESVSEETDGTDQTWHVQQMVQMAITLAPILKLRTWQLWIGDSGAPDLVCSDSPVALSWTTAVAGPYPPGLGLKNTVVTVPLHKRLAMVGRFEKGEGRRLVRMNEVAQLNSAMGMYAGQLYSPGPEFVWLMKNGAVGGRSDLSDALKASAA
jgi:hypothetical protein